MQLIAFVSSLSTHNSGASSSAITHTPLAHTTPSGVGGSPVGVAAGPASVIMRTDGARGAVSVDAPHVAKAAANGSI